MALLAESLVEEWLNRDHYFTIRGLKYSKEKELGKRKEKGEIDLLAIRHTWEGPEGRHVEVTVSFKPMGYIGKNIEGKTVGTRTPDQVREYARDFVERKFKRPRAFRDRLWPHVKWTYHLVYGTLRYKDELKLFEAEGVTCTTFRQVLDALIRPGDRTSSGHARGDFAEIIGYYASRDPRDA